MKLTFVLTISLFLINCMNGGASNDREKKISKADLAGNQKNRPSPGESFDKQGLAIDTTIDVAYSAIECSCPQWFMTKDSLVKEKLFFYLEPTTKDLVNANQLWDGVNLPLTLTVVGRFSKDYRTPETYHSKGRLEKGKIFYYDKIIIKSKESSKPQADARVPLVP